MMLRALDNETMGNVITMPALSPSMTEGTLARWFVKEGDTIAAGDVLAEIETDKATMELEAEAAGVIAKLEVPAETADVKVGAIIALLADRSASEANLLREVSEETSELPAAAPVDSKQGEVAETQNLAVIVAPSETSPCNNAGALLADGRLGSSLTPHETIGLSMMRKTIARRLTEAKQQIPHIYLSVDVRLDKLVALRAELNAALEAPGNGLLCVQFSARSVPL